MVILKFILSCLYFFLPAYFTNMASSLVKKHSFLKFLDKPIDSGKKFKEQPIFGSHKSWRGLIFGIVIGFLVVFSQKFLYQFPTVQKISFLDYQKINIYLFGFLICFGAIFGDLLFAFIKRRLKLKPGARFFPFDQINYVIGAVLFLTPYFWFYSYIKGFSIWMWIALFILTFFLHIIINRLGYLLNLHKDKW